MTASADCGNGRQHGSPGFSAAARVRAAGEDFTASFVQLRRVIEATCGRHTAWEGKVVAGIRAMLEFAAADVAKAEALTLKARRPDPGGGRLSDQDVIAYFVGLLGEVAPGEMRHPISTDEAIVESIATVVRGHLIDGTASRLPDAAPDLIYLVLMPYLGHLEARRWGETAPPFATSGTS